MIISKNGVKTPDLVIDFNGQGSSTLVAPGFDPTITTKPDWLIEFNYGMARDMDPNVSNNTTYGSGQLMGDDASIIIYPTPASVYAETCLIAGTAIPSVTVYRVADLLGVLTGVENWAFTNVIVTGVRTTGVTNPDGTSLANLIEVTFQWQQLQHTLNSYNSTTLAAQGSVVSLVNFSTGVLTPPAAGGGGAAPAATA